jgi:undecaprenyl-diphosphatase
MSAANGLRDGEGALLPLRRCVTNAGAAIQLLLRPARARGEASPFDWRQLAMAGGLIIGAFLLCMILIDAAVVRWVGTLPPAIPWLFDQITDYGKSAWFLWPLGILFLLLASLRQSKLTHFSQLVLAAVMVRVGFLFLAVAVPGLFINILKRIVGRARPGVPGTIDPFVFDPFNWSAAYASLPSGHATTVLSVIVAFGSLWPRARTVLWIYALVIMASRIAVTAHFPSDVLAGAVFGTLGAMLVRRYFALRRLAFSIGPNGGLHALPGPSLKRVKALAREVLA